MAIHSLKSQLKFNRPVYIEQAILDLLKVRMYDFWYNQITKQYGEKAQLLYTDIDSLLYKVETEDVYTDMKANALAYDFLDYPKLVAFATQQAQLARDEIAKERQATKELAATEIKWTEAAVALTKAQAESAAQALANLEKEAEIREEEEIRNREYKLYYFNLRMWQLDDDDQQHPQEKCNWNNHKLKLKWHIDG